MSVCVSVCVVRRVLKRRYFHLQEKKPEAKIPNQIEISERKIKREREQRRREEKRGEERRKKLRERESVHNRSDGCGRGGDREERGEREKQVFVVFHLFRVRTLSFI